MNNIDVEFYFNQGFVPDKKKAQGALQDLLIWVNRYSEDVESCSIVDLLESAMDASSETIWDITLTAGLDSRFIYSVLQKRKIKSSVQCYTWGRPFSADVRGARSFIDNNDHYILDTRSVRWDEEVIIAYLSGLRPIIGSSIPRLDAVWLFRNLEKFMRPESNKINGFLGDMLSGAHLKSGLTGSDPVGCLINLNRTGIMNDFDVREVYDDFLFDNKDLISELLSVTFFTKFDLLDYAFRQRQRIEPVMRVSGNKWISPFDNEKVIVKWALTSLEDRIDQKRYIEEFNAIKDCGYSENYLDPLIDFFSRVWDRIERKPIQMKNLADPLKNPSLRNLMEASCASFDSRNLLNFSTLKSVKNLLKNPNEKDWKISIMATSLDLHIKSN